MPRYIDAEKLIKHLKDEISNCAPPIGGRAHGKTLAIGTGRGLKMAISFAETLSDEQVVPRERYDRVMDNLKAVLAERAEEKSEVAREIFAEIRKIVTAIYNKHIFGSDLEDEEKEAVMDFEVDISSAFDELEEEYGITDNAPKE